MTIVFSLYSYYNSIKLSLNGPLVFCLAHLRTSKKLGPPLFVGTKNQNYSMISDQAKPTIDCSGFTQLLCYCVAGNVCGSLFLQIGNCLCFAGTNFCDKNRLVFLAGNQFLRFSQSTQYPALIIFSLLLSTCNRNTYFQTILPYAYPM